MGMGEGFEKSVADAKALLKEGKGTDALRPLS